MTGECGILYYAASLFFQRDCDRYLRRGAGSVHVCRLEASQETTDTKLIQVKQFVENSSDKCEDFHFLNIYCSHCIYNLNTTGLFLE